MKQETYHNGITIDVNNIQRENSQDPATIPACFASIINGKQKLLSDSATSVTAASDRKCIHRICWDIGNMSPWNTSQAIVDLLDHIAPKDIYRKLKLALLLSAVSLSEERELDEHSSPTPKCQIRASVHVLVVKNNYDTVIPALIASMASCKRSVKDGILRFELDQLDKKRLNHLAPILSTVEGSDIRIQCNDSIQALNLVCCCWSTFTRIKLDHHRKIENDGEMDEDSQSQKLNHGIPMVDAFDIVVLQDEMEGVSEVSQKVARHITQQLADEFPVRASDHLYSEDLPQYIKMASKIQVRLSSECEQLLRSYFQVLRVKGSGLDRNELSSISVMSTLLKLAACHAKLCFRSVAVTDDALVSIMMLEETLAARFSMSRIHDSLYGGPNYKEGHFFNPHPLLKLLDASQLGFVPLLDGKENVARLYGCPLAPDSVQDEELGSTVPMLDCSEYDKDADVHMMDVLVPLDLQRARDLIAERM
ncbi:Minichromosome maintenance domain-containing protein 2 [Mortierella claussenii]|nr:Minichromosome maintenance domain-containing protein 2 [Mortierella claussenii]